jgi:hypothetical protein
LNRSETRAPKRESLLREEIDEPRGAGIGGRRRHSYSISIVIKKAAPSYERHSHRVSPPENPMLASPRSNFASVMSAH